jgi:hypothetical protein
MLSISVVLHFPKGYIGHPYWPERERLITIQKESGVNRARSLDKREKTLRAYLASKTMTMDDYRALEARAGREFYTVADVDDAPAAPPDEIVIPSHHLHGMMGQAADMAPASVRLARPEQIRNLVVWQSLRTGQTKPNRTWERFVTVKSGTGQTLSNQRGLRVNQYLEDVTARGALTVVNPEHAAKARQFIEWAGEEIGVGASRKLGWGRFTIIEWAPKG